MPDAASVTSFLVEPSGDFAYFGFNDGTLCKYESASGKKLASIKRHSDAIYQLAFKDNFILSCSEDNFVYKYESTDLENTDLLQRLASAVRSIDISADGKFFVLAGDQMDLCIVNYVDCIEMNQLEGHSHSIVGVKIDPTSSWIATASYDGNCIVWKKESSTSDLPIFSIFHKFPINMTQCKKSNTSVSLSWNPSQQAMLAVPNGDSVILFNVVQKSIVKQIQIHSPKHYVQFLQFSPNGNWLAIAAGSDLFLYNLCFKKLILAKQFGAKEIIDFYWMNEECCIIGFNNETLEKILFPPEILNQSAEVGIKKNSLETVDDLSDDENQRKKSLNFNEDSLEDLIDQMANDNEQNDTVQQVESKIEFHTVVANIMSQDSFMPNATPFVHNFRYLAWNSLGYVLCRQDDSKSKIDVEFFESEKYRPIRFLNNDGFSMASIGSKGVLFASEYFDERNPSVVKFIPYESWAPNSDWSFVVPLGDSVSLIAMSKKTAVLFFESNQIAVYSLNGILKADFKWPCRKAIAMTSFENELLLFWIADTGSIMFTLFDLESLSVIHTGVFSVRTEHVNQIIWIGFSEIGIPLCYVDNGCLYGLFRGCFFTWTVLLNYTEFRSPKNESIWPISVTFDNILLYVACYGDEKYPNPSLKIRTVSEHVLKPSSTIPLNDNENSLFLLQLMRDCHSVPQSLILDEDKKSFIDNVDYQLDKQLLELILSSLNSNRQSKAIELVTLLTLENSYQKAVRLCQHLKLYDLADKVDLLRERTFNQNDSSAFAQSKHHAVSSLHDSPRHRDESSQILFDGSENVSTYNAAEDKEIKHPNNSVTNNLLKSPVKAFLANLPVSSSVQSKPAMPSFVPKSKNPFNKS